mgnify:CR=1 FL=1
MGVFRTVVASLAVVGLLAASVLSGCEQRSEGLISKEEAVAVAMQAFAERPAVIPSTTAPAGEAPTSTVPLGVVVDDADLIHCDAPGITGGEDMMVWTIHLGGSTSEGVVNARVYVDAETGELLTYWLGP